MRSGTHFTCNFWILNGVTRNRSCCRNQERWFVEPFAETMLIFFFGLSPCIMSPFQTELKAFRMLTCSGCKRRDVESHCEKWKLKVLPYQHVVSSGCSAAHRGYPDTTQ